MPQRGDVLRCESSSCADLSAGRVKIDSERTLRFLGNVEVFEQNHAESVMKRKVSKREKPQRVTDPTPEEIRVRCAAIRKRWDDRTHRIRAGQAREFVDALTTWRVPECLVGDLANVFDDEATSYRAA